MLVPIQHGLDGHGAFAQAIYHQTRRRFDTLGDGDFAGGGQQLHRTDLFQIRLDGILDAQNQTAGLAAFQLLGKVFVIVVVDIDLFGIRVQQIACFIARFVVTVIVIAVQILGERVGFQNFQAQILLEKVQDFVLFIGGDFVRFGCGIKIHLGQISHFDRGRRKFL